MKIAAWAECDQNFGFYWLYYKLWVIHSLFVHSLHAKALFRKVKKVIKILAYTYSTIKLLSVCYFHNPSRINYSV